MKIRPFGAEFLNADGETDGQTHKQTDMEKLKVAFRNSVMAPKNINSKCLLLPGTEDTTEPTGRSDKLLFLLDFL